MRRAAFALALALVVAPATGAAQRAAPPDEAATLRAELERTRAEAAALAAWAVPAEEAESLDARKRAAARLVAQLGTRIDALSVPATPVQAPLPLAPAGPPPHPVADVDRLRDQLDSLTAQRAVLRPLASTLDAELDAAAAQRRRGAETLRLRTEALERARGDAEIARARDALQLARFDARSAELELARADDARSSVRARLRALEAPIEQLAATVDAARRAQRIDATDLARVRAQAADTRRRIDAERAALAERIARHDADGPAPRPLHDAMTTLGELDAVEAGRLEVWSQRRAALDAAAAGETAATRAAVDALRRSIEQTRAHERSIDERIALLRTEERVRRPGPSSDAGRDAVPTDARTADALRLHLDALERTRAALQGYSTMLERTLDDVTVDGATREEAGGLAALASRAAALARRLWQLELFSATETTTVEGRTVTVDYGVTVGKSIGALALFAGGAWLASRLSRRVTDALVRRGTMSEALGRVLRRWLMTLLLLAVLLVVLKLARVPLTAFAFLGGAVAIGVGFGTQNLIKNLISGVIVLFERKVRVGDVVTIDGVTGTVASVDLRATTVRGFDGIDSVLPNSRLLEGAVADWSHGDRRLRGAIRVPVAADADPATVAGLVLDCARAHPQVLDDPPPQALFDDFGPEGLVFVLWYWFRLGGARPGPLIASDLRFAIERALVGRGIAHARSRHRVELELPDAVRAAAGAARPVQERGA